MICMILRGVLAQIHNEEVTRDHLGKRVCIVDLNQIIIIFEGKRVLYFVSV